MRSVLPLVIACTLFCSISIAAEPPRLIAHRGGVVEEGLIENNKPALEEAIDRGYWMLEVDVRESKDGHLVVHHDANFSRYYGDKQLLSEMTWDEISQLRSTPGDLRPLLFAEYAALCKDRIRVMIDTKEPEHGPTFYETMLAELEKNDLLDTAYVIGTEESKQFFLDKARVGINAEALEQAVQRGENVAERYFLFTHGKGLDAAVVKRAQELGVPVVPSINTFHYFGQEHMPAAKADALRLKELGVVEFQIDSVYDPWLRPTP